MDVQTNCKKCGHDLAGWHSCGHCLTWNGQDFDAVLKERDALQGKLEVAVEALRHLVAMVGKCSCHEAYTSRKLTDPNCGYCNLEAEDAEQVLAQIGDISELSPKPDTP